MERSRERASDSERASERASERESERERERESERDREIMSQGEGRDRSCHDHVAVSIVFDEFAFGVMPFLMLTKRREGFQIIGADLHPGGMIDSRI